ncbi:EAL domain-containing protein [Vogesella indigofera]|uniref:EAL domain-containing protein n=1 Tax=Vogesella indigofera TaxID=45465 RepID=UPI003F42D144
MNSTADILFSPEEAAEAALDFLFCWQLPLGASVWGKLGEAWRCLAQRGDVSALPTLQADVPLPPLDAAVCCQVLGSHAQPLGFLFWHGCAASERTAQLALLLTGHLTSASLRNDLSAARVTHHTLLDINRLANESQNVEHFLRRLHRAVSRLMPADNFYIALLDESGNALRFPYFADVMEPRPPRPDEVFPCGGQTLSLTAWLCRQHSFMLLSGAEIDKLCRQQGVVMSGLMPSWWMGVPLLDAASKVVGAVVVQSYDVHQRFDDAAQSAFLFIAHHIASALDRLAHRAELERKVWLRTAELEGINIRLHAEVAERKRTEQLQSVLFRIGDISNTSLSMEAFFVGLHRLLSEFIDASNCMVCLHDSERNELSFPYCSDLYLTDPLPQRPGRGLLEQVLHSGRPLLLAEASGHVLLASDDHDIAVPVSWLGVPLYSGNELRGVLAVQSYEPSVRYSYRDQELLEFVANHIGSALARVQALDDLQRAYADLEQRVLERTNELDAVNAQLQHDSLHDPLTKLPNRSYFSRVLKRNWDQFQLDPTQRFAVVFIDLDRFKLVNDTLGHLAGDHLLTEAGQRIRSCLGYADFLARLGGDEFAVLLSGVDSLEECERLAQSLVGEFERPIMLSGRELFTTVSVGLVLADKEHYSRAEDLLRDADHAMYRTKQRGRHGYTLFNHELRRNQADQLALEAELRHALENRHELVPYYQAIVDSHSGKLAGFETLVRWHHPQRGLIAPSVFLPMAEESGLILKLDRYMIEHACAQLAQWYGSGRIDHAVCLHINLSSAHFHDPGLVGWLQELMQRHALPVGTLHLEITESALIDVPDVAIEVMRQLKERGICLALDDFGTGYSALSYLHRYHFDVLKIDQAFVRDIHCHEESSAIVRAILALAAALGLDVVAEGVETMLQVQTLRQLGCPRLQGYYFARPAPAAELDWPRLAGMQQELAHAGDGLLPSLA